MRVIRRPHCGCRLESGFSLVELVAVAVVIAVLAAVLFRLAADYAEEAEKTAMEAVASGVRAALHLRVAGLIAQNADEAIPALAAQNPIDWLSDKPHLYAGAFEGVASVDAVQPRSWYYDTHARELVYRVERTRHLQSPRNPQHDIRFKVWIEQGALMTDMAPAATLRGLRRVEFTPVETYDWRVFAN